MWRERVLGGIRGIALLASSALQQSCDEPFDWCTEARDEGAIPASGEVSIRYQSDSASEPTLVTIKPYVRLESDRVTVQGCGRHGGDLWRWTGRFAGLVPGTDEQAVSSEGTDVTYGGELRYCKGGSCTIGNIQTIVTSYSAKSLAGTVTEYQPATGPFRSTLDLGLAADASVNIKIDIQWEASE